jgi:hypothetical protein
MRTRSLAIPSRAATPEERTRRYMVDPDDAADMWRECRELDCADAADRALEDAAEDRGCDRG